MWLVIQMSRYSKLMFLKRFIIIVAHLVIWLVCWKWKLLSRVWLFTTPWTVACQAPLSMGFIRQGYWSGLPCSPPGDLPNPGIQPRSPTLQAYSLPNEPPGRPRNTGVGSLSLLQGIFPIQELNWGLLHCRRIPYQLSYWGSPLLFKFRILKWQTVFKFLVLCILGRSAKLLLTIFPVHKQL